MSVRRSAALIAAVLVGVAVWVLSLPRAATELAFLAVGQGDATLLRSQRHAVLIDMGPPGSGRRVIVPELRRRGVRKLDMVALTHPDTDHIGGLAEVARSIPIAKVVAPAHFRGHPQLESVLAAAKIGPDRMAWVAGPSEARVGGCRLFMDVPPWQDGLPDNEGSLITKVDCDGATATLPGDAGFLAETDMMQRGVWRAQVLKLGHHGSRYSSGDAWLDHVRPSLAVVSCGRDNNYGHPAPEVIERCIQRGIKVVRTDREGTISLKVKNGQFVR